VHFMWKLHIFWQSNFYFLHSLCRWNGRSSLSDGRRI